MSLVDIVLNERTILLGIGAALAPLLIAMLLWMVTSMRRTTAQRKAQRAAAAAHRAEALALAAAQQAERTAPAATSAFRGQPEEAGQGKERDGKAQESKLNLESVENKREGQEEQQEGEEVEVSAAMQDILSSVFEDDSSASPYTALLQNLSTVETSNLVAFADQISTLLKSPGPVVADEEH